MVPRDHELKCEGVALVLPPGALITGRSAATLRGAGLARWEDPVEVLVPESSRRTMPRGTVARRCLDLPAGEMWAGAPVLAPPLRTAFDLAARVPLHVGVAALDAVVRSGHCELEVLQRWLRGIHDQGVVAARAAAELCDPRAESPPESHLRVICRLGGLDVVPQFEVRHGGSLVARVDLALPEHRVAIEYDGAWHVLREQLEKDRSRQRRLREAGWEVVHVTAAVLRDPEDVLLAVRSALARQGRTVRGAAW